MNFVLAGVVEVIGNRSDALMRLRVIASSKILRRDSASKFPFVPLLYYIQRHITSVVGLLKLHTLLTLSFIFSASTLSVILVVPSFKVKSNGNSDPASFIRSFTLPSKPPTKQCDGRLDQPRPGNGPHSSESFLS